MRRSRPQRPARSPAGGARETALQVLLMWERGGSLEHVLDESLASSDLDPRDRALATHLVQGTLRLRRRLDSVIDAHVTRDREKLPVPILTILRMAVYQLLELDRIPASAAVDEAVRLAKKYGHPGTAGLVNAVLRAFVRAGREVPRPPDDPVRGLAVSASYPDWMVERWVARWGIEEARLLAEAGNRIPALTLRVNRRRTDAAELTSVLERRGHEVALGLLHADSLRLPQGGAILDLPGFREGHFQVQDESSSLVAVLASPAPGSSVADLCAGSGGKSSHLAEVVGDRGIVVGVDLARWRLRRLMVNARRLGLGCLHAVCGDAARPCVQPVDTVCLDAPCTGTGVLARRADARWRRRPEDLPRLAALQTELLEAASGLVKIGGLLVYSVCSLEPEEGEDVVGRFLARRTAFRLENAGEFVAAAAVTPEGFLRTSPHRHGVDGMFAARMRRVGSEGL